MPSINLARIRQWVSRHPNEVIRELLNQPFWPEEVRSQTHYSRISDDNRAVLSVAFSPDADGWIDVVAKPDPNEPGSMRFRTHRGGGVSPRVRNALLILAVAIKLDELEHPINPLDLDLGKPHP